MAPFGAQVPVARRYLPGTLVLETTWQVPTGWVIVRDALIMGPWHNLSERSKTHRRAPSDVDASHCLLRTVECLYGTVDITVDCQPVFDYGRTPARWNYPRDDYSQLTAAAVDGGPALSLTSSLRLGVEGRAATARTRMRAGDRHFVALTFSELPAPTTMEQADAVLAETGEFWRQWLSHGSFPDHPWRAYLQSSALALKGLSYAPTGALLAAATTSLPETPGGERNWDYRYSWIRDSTFALWGLYTLGFDREADDFFYFIHDACAADPANLQIMYGVDGRRGTRREHPGAPVRLRRLPTGPGRQRAPTASDNTTSGVRCSTRCTCTPGPVTSWRRNCGRSSSPRSIRPPPTGANPIAASGRYAEIRSTSP